MANSAAFGRLLTAMVTPMKPDGAVDYEKAAKLAEQLVETGSDGVVVSGTTGESPTLTRDEKLELFRVVTEAIGDRASVIAGTGSYNTAESVKLTEDAARAGVSGIMAVVPYYNKPPQSGLVAHFTAIADASDLPLMLYNVPSRTAHNLVPETVARLAEHERIVAVKEASGDPDQISEIRRTSPPSLSIYAGDDSSTLPVLALGGVGVVSVCAHLVGRRIRDMIDAFLSGRVEEATRIHLELFPIFRGLFYVTNPVPVKWALKFTGMDAGPVRSPLVSLTPDEEQAVEKALQDGGLLS